MSDTAAPTGAPAAPQAGAANDNAEALPAPGQAANDNREKPRGPDGKFQAESAAQKARRLKLMLDGQEVELDESEVVGNYRKGKNAAQLLTKAEQRAREVAREKAELEAQRAKLKDRNEFWRLAQELGHNPRDMAAEQIRQEIEDQQLTPEQRRIRDLERSIHEREETERKTKEQQAQAALEEEAKRHMDELAHLFTETMAKTGLPKSSARVVMGRIAAIYQAAETAGEQVDADTAATLVHEAVMAEKQAMIDPMSPQELAAFIGEKKLNEVMRWHIEKYREKKRGAAPKSAAPTPLAFEEVPRMAPQPRKIKDPYAALVQGVK